MNTCQVIKERNPVKNQGLLIYFKNDFRERKMLENVPTVVLRKCIETQMPVLNRTNILFKLLNRNEARRRKSEGSYLYTNEAILGEGYVLLDTLEGVDYYMLKKTGAYDCTEVNLITCCVNDVKEVRAELNLIKNVVRCR